MSATDTKSLVDRLANDDLKENYALKVFPPILLMIMMSADELNPVKLCVLPDVVPLTLRTSPHAPHLTHLTASGATLAASASTPAWRPSTASGCWS